MYNFKLTRVLVIRPLNIQYSGTILVIFLLSQITYAQANENYTFS